MWQARYFPNEVDENPKEIPNYEAEELAYNTARLKKLAQRLGKLEDTSWSKLTCSGRPK